MTQWSPKSFVGHQWAWQESDIHLLSDALERRNTEISDKTSDDLTLLSIRFNGSMDARSLTPESLKGKLYLAEAGDVVFSKIDV